MKRFSALLQLKHTFQGAQRLNTNEFALLDQRSSVETLFVGLRDRQGSHCITPPECRERFLDKRRLGCGAAPVSAR